MSTQMEKLLAAQEKTQEKLRRAQEEEKQLKKRIAELKRNERTHRLSITTRREILTLMCC